MEYSPARRPILMLPWGTDQLGIESDTENVEDLATQMLVSNIIPTYFGLKLHKPRTLAIRFLPEYGVERVFEPFLGLRSLRRGWNGPGSSAVSATAWEVALAEARRFLNRLPGLSLNDKVRFKLVPDSDGGLDMIWRAPDRAWELTVEIPAGGTGSLSYTAEDGGALHVGDLSIARQFEDAINFLALRIGEE